jgi:cell wall-associated NlpC family hydrolase
MQKRCLALSTCTAEVATKGFDCSGFVSYVFKKFGITLQRTSAGMGNGGKPVEKSALKPGDLVFFDTNGGLNRINHVGIYIGDGKFIHASSYLGRKVTISSSERWLLQEDLHAGKGLPERIISLPP